MAYSPREKNLPEPWCCTHCSPLAFADFLGWRREGRLKKYLEIS
jgi:hypothetical protein